MNKELEILYKEYKKSPKVFHASNYWMNYENKILKSISELDITELRSGKYPAFAHFGFNDIVYAKLNSIFLKAIRFIVVRLIQKYLGWNSVLPYRMSINDIRKLAYKHCELYSESTGAIPINKLSMSTFGHPLDQFTIEENTYSMLFLSYYIRYCFANKNINFAGNEILVELGPGSGYQIEILKKLYPGLTILCFDLPSQLYLCEKYLSNVFESDHIVSSKETLDWEDLHKIKKGSIHFFGNWKFPLLEKFKFDVFWNAASFGEMEPNIVKNYLSYIEKNVEWIYLLQAKNGKESSGINYVKQPIKFNDYDSYLSGFELIQYRDALKAHKSLDASGGYFEGIWNNK